jgi:hypothetical protein
MYVRKKFIYNLDSKKKSERKSSHTPVGFNPFVVDVTMIVIIVFAGTSKFVGKSTLGETSDGGTTVVVPGGVPANGVVVDVSAALADTVVEVIGVEIKPFG